MLRFIVMFLALGLGACGTIPTDALNSYTAAFDKAHAASDDFLVQFGQTKKTAQSFIAANTPPASRPYRPYADRMPPLVSGSPDIDSDVETMRLAFIVISQYNATLVALADGKSDATVGAAAKGLVTALGGLVPVGGGIATAAGALASELEKARRREEFKQAITKGAPLVRKILALITDNVDTNYDNNVALADNARTLLISAVIDRVTALQLLFTAHKPPAAGPGTIPLATRQSSLNTLLTPISQERGIAASFPYPLAYSGGGQDYTADTEAQVTASFDQLADMISRLQAITRRMNGLLQSGTAYKAMLGATLDSLAALEKADKVPPDLSQQASEMLRLAFAIKTHVEDIRAAGNAR